MADNGTNNACTTFMNNPEAITTSYFIAVLTGIACFNALELILLIPVTFSRWNSLYFWAILIASAGVLPYSVGFLLYFFDFTSHWVALTLVTIGWWPMVTGQSVVLYSRLHLISKHKPFLKWILGMIIFNAICLHIPTTVLTFLAKGPSAPSGHHQPFGIDPNAGDAAPHNVSRGYTIMEKIQMMGFCIQEFIISAVYLWETFRLMKLDYSRKSKKLMSHLITINVIIILMDIVLLFMEYSDRYTVETTLKGLVYSVKLRLEFAVLSQLVEFTKPGHSRTIDTASLNGEGFTLAREPRHSYEPSFITNAANMAPVHYRLPFGRRSTSPSIKNAQMAYAAHHYEDVDPLDVESRYGETSTTRDVESTSRDFARESSQERAGKGPADSGHLP